MGPTEMCLRQRLDYVPIARLPLRRQPSIGVSLALHIGPRVSHSPGVALSP